MRLRVFFAAIAADVTFNPDEFPDAKIVDKR